MEKAINGTALKNERDEEQHWRVHVVGAAQFSGSNTEYCRTQGLNYRVFRVFKKKLGATRPYPNNRKNGFVKLEPTSDGVSARELYRKTLPDPRWTAQFISALMDIR